MLTITLRPATIEDIPTIQQVGRSSRVAAFVESGFLSVEKNERAWSVDMLTMSMTAPSNHAIVAVENEQIVGYLSGRCQNPQDEGQVRLYRIYLHPNYWGRGVGYMMWQSYWDALAADVQRVDVGSLVWNEQATRFYQRLGFETVSTEGELHQLQLTVN